MSNPLGNSLHPSSNSSALPSEMPDWLQAMLSDEDWSDLAVITEEPVTVVDQEQSDWAAAFADDPDWNGNAPDVGTSSSSTLAHGPAEYTLDFTAINQTIQVNDAAISHFSDHINGQSDLIILDGFEAARGGEKGKPGGSPGPDPEPDPEPDRGLYSEYTSGHNILGHGFSDYNIDIIFKGTWTADLQEAFIDAAEFISSFITGDVGDISKYRGKFIDDIRIDATLSTIDGEGGVLGQAGPTAVRSGVFGDEQHYLPAAAVMEFDVADAAFYDGIGLFDDIVYHEMMHSIGFGTIWDYKGLIDNSDPTNPLFTGSEATASYISLYGDTGASGVPIEENGGSGTAYGHWDEGTGADRTDPSDDDPTLYPSNEIMAGYINSDNDLSGMTLASLADLGYVTTASYDSQYDTWVDAGFTDFLGN